MLRPLIALSVLSAAAPNAVAEGDIENGKALIKAWECTQCHGLTGNDRSAQEFPVPMLAGQPTQFLFRRLKQYKSLSMKDSKPWQRMRAYAQGLSEKDMLDIAAYYAVQKRY